MSKKYFVSLGIIATFLLTTGISVADIQSPIYTDDVGRSHFLGRGGYSTTRQVQMDATQADIVNQTVNELSKNNETSVINNPTEKKITDVIKEKDVVPASSRSKMTITPEQRRMDASAPYGYGMTDIRPAGVNESKTIYTDDIGRLHFFGRANQFKD